VTSPPQQLDVALAERLRQVVGGKDVSESEMRMLADHADGWARATRARLHAAEGRLAQLNADPASSLAEIAAELRRVEALSHEREEIRRLTDGLEQRTRQLRTAWLTHHAEAGSPSGPQD
jgi:hypothetical protein